MQVLVQTREVNAIGDAQFRSLDRSLEGHMMHQWPSSAYGIGVLSPCVAF
jgi:hypothetical protein